MRIGLIQTRGIGDLIIALPIANWFLDQGHEVFWPVDCAFTEFMRDADNRVQFIDVATSVGGVKVDDYFYYHPLQYLRDRACDRIFLLYSMAGDLAVSNPRLALSLKFDEYKYAITGVPFTEKWKLRINRNHRREQALFESLKIERQYICVHRNGSGFHSKINLPPEWQAQYQIIEMGPVTSNPFDWIYTLEKASKLVMIDSCFANLVEGLNINCEKVLIVRSECRFTPVFKNNWRWI